MTSAPDPCPICGKYYPVLEYLLEHIERRHSDIDSGFVATENVKDLYRDVSPSSSKRRGSRQRDKLLDASSNHRAGGLLKHSSKSKRLGDKSPLCDQPSIQSGSTSTVKSRLLAWAEYASGKNHGSDKSPKSKIRSSARTNHRQRDNRESAFSESLHSQKEQSSRNSDGAMETELEDPFDSEYRQCPLEECGELVFSENLDLHIELHQAEQLALDERNSTEVAIANQSTQDPYSQSATESSKPSANGHISYFVPGGPAVPALKMAENSRPSSRLAIYGDSADPYLASDLDTASESSKSKSQWHSSAKHGQLQGSDLLERPSSSRLDAFSNLSGRSRSVEKSIQPIDNETASSRDSIRDLLSNTYHKYKDGLLSSLEDDGTENQKKPNYLRKRKRASQRLGAADLGPYAKEDQMPRWLRYQLERGPRMIKTRVRGLDGRHIEEIVPENETSGIVPILAQMSAMDEYVGFAYYCHPAVTHICKTPREGGFCGYRNAQMLMSYIRGARAPGHDRIPLQTPGILLMQDWIEDAWDHSPDGQLNREAMGKLRGTRKWIGSVEASAMFHHLGINCSVIGFTHESDRTKLAYEFLLDRVQSYFESDLPMHFDELGRMSPPERINRTHMPPIYLQEPGHSVTVVGLEIFSNGSRGLVVLDPMYITSKAMDQMLEIGPNGLRIPRWDVMDAYRRGERRLYRYPGFEILTLDDPHPVFPAWQVRSPEVAKVSESPLKKLKRLL